MKNNKLIYFAMINIFLVSTICIFSSSQIAQKNQLSNTNQTTVMQIAPIIDQPPINKIPLIAKALPNQTGWPISVVQNLASPALVDLDQDGDLEVLRGGSNFVVRHHDGSIYWQKSIGSEYTNAPAIGDIDGDGDLEVVIGSWNGNVYAWHHDGSSALVFATGNAVRSSPALGDLDNDGDLEIVIGSDDYNVWAFNSSGHNVTGWPKATSMQVYSSPALGDIDDDGDLEIVVRSGDKMLYAWHHNGTIVTGFPQLSCPDYFPWDSPALGDLDDDGDLEILIGSGPGNFTAWHHNGTLYWQQNPSFQQRFDRSSPALGDIDGDGDLEIVVGSRNTIGGGSSYVYAWHHNGSSVVGWPKATGANVRVRTSPVLGDIDGDGDIEIVVTTLITPTGGIVYAWHHNGSLVNDWPFTLAAGADASPALGDLDSDGDIEVVVASGYDGVDSKLYAWDCSGVFDPVNVPWRRYHHDNHGTGLAGYVAELMVCITSPTEGILFTTDNVIFTWSAEGPVGIDNYSVQIDSSGWIPVGTNTTYTFSGLSNGNHSIYVRAFDAAGNNATDYVNFTVNVPKIPKKDGIPFLMLLSFMQQEGIPILYIGVIGAVVAVVAVVVVVLFLRRRK